MPRYRLDYLHPDGVLLAMHEIDYDCDELAIRAAHAINGFPPIAASFQVWREGQLLHWHHDKPPVLN